VLNLSGNVSEWVADWFEDYAPARLSNPVGPEAGDEKLIKGCSWFFHPAYCRGAARPSADPATRFDYLGFRCAVSAPDFGGSGETLTVPVGPAPLIDGTISPGEWDQAWQGKLADSSELFLLHEEGFLYLAVRSSTPDMIVGNVHLQRGDEIFILHTSAALGTGVYQEQEAGWKLIRDFAWCCRMTGQSETARTEREAFLQAEGWTGINSRVGSPNELEYKIELRENELRLALSVLRATETDVKIPWPADLMDDVIRLTPGGLPEWMDFSPEDWVTIQVEN
jgi:hypothetical protein